MQSLSQVLAVALFAALSLSTPASGAALRRQQVQTLNVSSPALLEAAGLPEIKAKWEKMDEFMEIMFGIACNWKHGKDVNGVVNEKLRAGKITGKEAEAFKKETQDQNLIFLKQSCGGVVAQQKGKCRQSCADRWGEELTKREDCDEKCIAVFDRWEHECNTKAVNLEKVYQMKLTAANSRKQCYEGYCQKYPQVWMRTDAAKMNTEVDTVCKEECKADRIKQACTVKWQLELDLHIANISTVCFNEGKVKECMDKEKTTIDKDFTDCKTKDGDKVCKTQYDKCTTDGKADKNFEEAKAFCEERKQMCEEQVSEKCLSKNRDLLDGAQKKCEDADSVELKKCKKKELAAKEKSSATACEAEKTPKCDKDCHKSCDVTKMSTCLKDLESPHDAGKAFCTDFYGLIHESSRLDEHGDPEVV